MLYLALYFVHRRGDQHACSTKDPGTPSHMPELQLSVSYAVACYWPSVPTILDTADQYWTISHQDALLFIHHDCQPRILVTARGSIHMRMKTASYEISFRFNDCTYSDASKIGSVTTIFYRGRTRVSRLDINLQFASRFDPGNHMHYT